MERQRSSSISLIKRAVSPWSVALVLVVVALAVLAIQWKRSSSVNHYPASSVLAASSPAFAGAKTCAGCHQREAQNWNRSHHQLAMQPATAATVLGDFTGAQFLNAGVVSTFFRTGAKFMVRTDGPDGALHDYAIKYTFGIDPLQQYLIELPGGRLQALGIAWDSRSRERGGQRWFFLYPGQKITYQDRLHWTGIDQNWNFMCADCHSTNVRKNYDPQTRTYATTYAAINVDCEACHGPGANHVAWAERRGAWRSFDANHGLTIALNERRGVAWLTDRGSGNVQRSRPRNSDREIQMCARCHARRGQIHEDFVHGQPVGDDYRVALLDPDLYFPDGQIKGEVYEYGSFIQSRMFHAGVTCSDCHEPHSLALRAEGNRVCLQCHSSQKYDSPTHHFHDAGSSGAQCVNCHMAARTYMVVDPRRDHSIRVPRPDLSLTIGTPNACSDCHRDKSAEWAAAAFAKWYGRDRPGFQRFAEPLRTGALGAPGAVQALAALVDNDAQPAIARATALAMLEPDRTPQTAEAVSRGARDASPLVRRAAAKALPSAGPQEGPDLLARLLTDPVRAVRIEAAEVSAGIAPDQLAPDVVTARARAIGEYSAAQELLADRPEAHLNLGLLYANEGEPERAETELKTALSLEPSFVPAAVNLADLDRARGRDANGEAVLRTGLRYSPDNAALLHALGLVMVRQHQPAQALALLGEAARRDPGNARYAYVYAVALEDNGDARTAIATLAGLLTSHPYDRDALALIATLLKQSGETVRAEAYASRLRELTSGTSPLQ